MKWERLFYQSSNMEEELKDLEEWIWWDDFSNLT